MTDAELPLPLRFELPHAAWRPVSPESLGVSNAAFLAVRQGTDQAYEPTLTISGGWRDDPATLRDIADETVARLRVDATDVEILDRQEVTTEHAPAVTQLIRAAAVIDGRPFDLRQGQVVAGYVDVEDPSIRVVVLYTLTCTAAQLPTVGREFQAFMASVEVVPPGPAPGAEPRPEPVPS